MAEAEQYGMFSEQLLTLMILKERLPKHHVSFERIEKELKNTLAGESGERRVRQFLQRELQLAKEPVIFPDIQIPYVNGTVQLDLLILHEDFVYVLEVKNMIGEFYFDQATFQFHRTVEGRKEGMRNPEAQLHRAVKAVEQFLGVPACGAIVLTSRSAKIMEGPKWYPAVSLEYLPFHLAQLENGESRFNVTILADRIQSLPGKVYSKKHWERYNISLDALRWGVTCPKCRLYSMERNAGKWQCAYCNYKSADAHNVTIQEYALLFSSRLPTRSAYKLLQVSDKYLLYRLLESSAPAGNARGVRQIKEDRELLRQHFGVKYT